jgi:hypothetical protein
LLGASEFCISSIVIDIDPEVSPSFESPSGPLLAGDEAWFKALCCYLGYDDAGVAGGVGRFGGVGGRSAEEGSREAEDWETTQAETSNRGSSRGSNDERAQVVRTSLEYERPVSCRDRNNKYDPDVQLPHIIPGGDCAPFAENSVEVFTIAAAQGNGSRVPMQKVHPVRRFVLWERLKESIATPMAGGFQEVSEVEGLFQQLWNISQHPTYHKPPTAAIKQVERKVRVYKNLLLIPIV